MKNLLAIVLVALLATTFTFAQSTDTKSATFSVNVIKALSITPTDHATLEVAKGSSRTVAWGISFAIDGEIGHNILCSLTEPANPSSGITLDGYTASAMPTALDAAGAATVTVTGTGLTATATAADYTFSWTLTASYVF